jgi:tetratricopeptide (TPR) repeat protein
VQEVEGYRTDVRVVNLSLLNTDWYINQLKRKAYLSDAVPFTMTEDYYRQGTRDAVLIMDNNREDDSTYVDINVALKQIMSKDLYRVPDGQGYNYFRSSHLYIPVDKQTVVANGTVPANLADRVAPVRWDLSDKGVLYKKDMMILDLLATNNWKRPVYFAITVGDESYLGLEPYFQLEGLAYRVIPVERESPDGQIGAVATDIMYKNLVEKFHWGNMNDPNVYLDETNLRMTMNFRNNFSRLAAALLTEGKRDQAKKVLDRCLEVMPDNTVPYNYFVLPIANLYYELGDKQKANEILSRLKKLTGDELAYYKTLGPSFKSAISNTVKRTSEIYKRIMYLDEMFKKRDAMGNATGPNQDLSNQDVQKAPVDSPAQMAGDQKQPTKTN